MSGYYAIAVSDKICVTCKWLSEHNIEIVMVVAEFDFIMQPNGETCIYASYNQAYDYIFRVSCGKQGKKS